jgi:CubicO group peptidase (beta-lactamase class C family)
MRSWLRCSVAAVFAVSVLGILAAAQSRRPLTDPRVDALFKAWSTTTPGCAIGVAVKGEPVVRAAYGMADLEHDVPNTPETIFEAGSVSKQFTAMAVMLLARDGRLSLDDAIRKHIPEVPASAGQVTIRQMLQHSSGLRDWGSLAAIAGWPRTTRVHTHAHVLDILSRQGSLNFAPGTRWSYSNSGYNLAAILVSRLSGMSFADFTRTRMFEPLGMRDTSWRDDYTRVVKRRAVAYSERQGRFATDMPFENVHGNGGLLTTVGDLLKWNENFAKPVVGDAALLGEMQRNLRFTDGGTHEYALGLYADTFKGVREVDHSGTTAGYRAHLGRYPDQQVSVAVLCNAGNADATAFAKSAAELYLTGLAVPPAPRATHTLTEAEAERLVGLYRSRQPAGIVTITRDGTVLSAQNIGRLVPLSATRFVTSDAYTFEFDGRGQLRRTDEFTRVDVFERVGRAKPAAEVLKGLAGRYVSDEVETTLIAAVDGDRLVLRRRPDSEIVLTPVYPDGFSSPLGWIVFHRDPAGRPAGLSVSQARVWDLRFTRQADSPVEHKSSARR